MYPGYDTSAPARRYARMQVGVVGWYFCPALYGEGNGTSSGWVDGDRQPGPLGTVPDACAVLAP